AARAHGLGPSLLAPLGALSLNAGTQPDERRQPFLCMLFVRTPVPRLRLSRLGGVHEHRAQVVREPWIVQPVPSYRAHRDTVAHQVKDVFRVTLAQTAGLRGRPLTG